MDGQPNLLDLPTALLIRAVEFLPPSFRFVGGASRRLREAAREAHGGRRETAVFGLCSTETVKCYLRERNYRETQEATAIQVRDLAEASRVAAGAGNMELLKWSKVIQHGTVVEASKHGQLEVLKYIHEQTGFLRNHTDISGAILRDEYLEVAVEGGHLEVVKWFKSIGFKFKYLTRLAAAAAGRLDVLQYLCKESNVSDTFWRSLSCEAAENGHLDILIWLHANGDPWDPSVCTAAVDGGNIDILTWLRSKGCPMDEETFATAAEQGRLDMMKYLRSEKCPWDSTAFLCAAREGFMEVLKWLHAEECPWDAGATGNSMYDGENSPCNAAAAGGHLEVLKWLQALGAAWDERTCRVAACEGHLEVLKWLHANGCPWGEAVCASAAARGELELLKWARSNGCPWDERTCSWAAQCGQFETLLWARDNQCPWNESVFDYDDDGNIEAPSDIIAWAYDNGCPTSDLPQYTIDEIKACTYF